MRPNKAEPAVHGCHYPSGMAVRMREALAIPLSFVVCPLQRLPYFGAAYT